MHCVQGVTTKTWLQCLKTCNESLTEMSIKIFFRGIEYYVKNLENSLFEIHYLVWGSGHVTRNSGSSPNFASNNQVHSV